MTSGYSRKYGFRSTSGQAEPVRTVVPQSSGCRTCYGRWCFSCKRIVRVFCHCSHGEMRTGRPKD